MMLGADNLVKLWTIKTNECIATYDQHEDKVLNKNICSQSNSLYEECYKLSSLYAYMIYIHSFLTLIFKFFFFESLEISFTITALESA